MYHGFDQTGRKLDAALARAVDGDVLAAVINWTPHSVAAEHEITGADDGNDADLADVSDSYFEIAANQNIFHGEIIRL